MKITLPLQQLPKNRNEHYRLLSDYFSGKEVQLRYSAERVEITISWPHDAAYYIDPDLQTGLDWWKSGILVQDIPFVFKQESKYQLSLNDNWTVFAWSKWLESRKQNGQTTEKVLILHVDDHRDCMSPLLFKQGPDLYLDPLTKCEVTLQKPQTILSAIKSGAIAVGSFMPVFFQQIANVEFRHLLPEHRLPHAYQPGAIKNNYDKDNLLCLECERPSMIFESIDNTGHSYFPTTNVDEFLFEIPKSIPVLVHVDMDFFNNRFDGDSDWETHDFIHNPTKDEVLHQIDKVFRAILGKVPSCQLENITIALSPGFFPAEFWKESIAAIDLLINKTYG